MNKSDEMLLDAVAEAVGCGEKAVLARVDDGTRYVLHRVVDMAPDGRLTLMGDANLHLREHCRREDVAGVVSMVIADDGVRRRPSRAWLWRKLWRMRPLLVKLFRMR